MKKRLGYFIVELVIVTLGVSISLLMNDRITKKREQKQEVQILEVILSNLEQDSVSNFLNGQLSDILSNSANAMTKVDENTPLDSFNIYLDHIASYSKNQTVDIGFRELSNSGIQLGNDSLYRSLLVYYTSVQVLLEEWNMVQSDYVLNQMIPFIIDHFPNLKADVGNAGSFAVSEIPKKDLLENTRYHNLLAAGLLYNKNIKTMGERRQQILRKLIKDLKRELKKR